MRVQDLQTFLGSFTKGSDAVKNAVIYVEMNGKLHAISGLPGHHSHRLVLKTEKPSSLILPDKLQKDY
mgnify:CR=1 FL=1